MVTFNPTRRHSLSPPIFKEQRRKTKIATELRRMYDNFFVKYGPQGWWPLLDHVGTNPTKTGSLKGYHCGDYSYPKTERQRFEICVGAILAQNTSWVNAEKAILEMEALALIDPERLLRADGNTLRKTIRPAGFFNQKAKSLAALASFYLTLNGQTPSREGLLNVWGIGKETADSILLYAYRVPTFVVDNYTKKILINLGLISEKTGYDDIKSLFEKSLPPDLAVYQEYHALLVNHSKAQRDIFKSSLVIP